tara:strand:+ start:7642 stop:8604 length:963 start_codon:yes stop_codon:yes gene_type:complete
MRLISLICVFFLIIPIFSMQTVSAQPDIEVGDWDIGFKEGENITKNLDEDGDVSVEFWVRNDYPLAIEVSFNFDSAFGAETNEIDSTSISAGGNDSFVLEFSSVDVLKFRAEKRESFSITVSIDSYGGVPSLGDEKSISGELTIPRIRGFEINIAELGGAMNAGTELNIDVEIRNIGNDIDLTAEAMFESKTCPQLDIPNIDALDDISIDAPLEGQSGMKTIQITISTPISHPSKNCDLEIELNSLGSINDGENISPAEDKITFEVRKTNSNDGNEEDKDSNSNSNQDSEEIVSRNFSPSPSFLLTILTVLCATVIIKRK